MYECLLQSHRIGHLPKIDTKRKDHKCIGLYLNKRGTMFLSPTRDLIYPGPSQLYGTIGSDPWAAAEDQQHFSEKAIYEGAA